jgi:hypothetical protein
MGVKITGKNINNVGQLKAALVNVPDEYELAMGLDLIVMQDDDDKDCSIGDIHDILGELCEIKEYYNDKNMDDSDIKEAFNYLEDEIKGIRCTKSTVIEYKAIPDGINPEIEDFTETRIIGGD